ncbi:phosphatase PAP2 family protein [Salinarimonas soli]|uniref:Inositolphosphotransferase Aur1/Ipt1 domain-containing protein n=1 Tax=Salinarimonas soli TaxID=1638099 RepID=A0A5B2VBI0_9HYPH|nr:phosphatase PAP2 family protein [Salinarimonas soli]KAA2236015.1 hypothetical protein F0L46_16695 [Salinarimonas soli]
MRPAEQRSWPLASPHVRRILAEDGVFHGLCVGYCAFAFVLLFALNALERFVPLMYLPLWATGAGIALLVHLLACECLRTVRAGSKRPLSDALAALRLRTRGRIVQGCLLVVSLGLLFGCFTSVKNALPLLSPFRFDKPLADLGTALHGGVAPWQWLHPILGHQPVTRFIEVTYSSVWMLLLVGFPVLLFVHPELRELRRRYLLTTFLTLVLLGNVLAGLGMSAGPVYYGHVTGDHGRYGELVRYLAFSKGLPYSAADIQEHLWLSLQTDQVELGTGISAFPSIHVAMATLFVLAARRIGRRLGAVFMAYWVLILAGSIHLGWHYSLDGYVSAVAVCGIWAMTRPRRAGRRAGAAVRDPGAGRGFEPARPAPVGLAVRTGAA